MRWVWHIAEEALFLLVDFLVMTAETPVVIMHAIFWGRK